VFEAVVSRGLARAIAARGDPARIDGTGGVLGGWVAWHRVAIDRGALNEVIGSEF